MSPDCMNELLGSVKSFHVKQISLLFLAAFGTDLLSRKHFLSHEVFDLLQNSLTFSCLQEETFVCRTCGGPGKKHLSHVKQAKGNYRKQQLDAKFQLLLASVKAAGGDYLLFWPARALNTINVMITVRLIKAYISTYNEYKTCV